MEYRLLGRTGLEVSCIAFGTDNFLDPTPEDEAAQMIDLALDAGINLLDIYWIREIVMLAVKPRR